MAINKAFWNSLGKDLYTLKEAAKITGIGISTIREWCLAGEIPHVREFISGGELDEGAPLRFKDRNIYSILEKQEEAEFFEYLKEEKELIEELDRYEQ